MRCYGGRSATVGGPSEREDGMRFTIAISREDDWYVARCLEVEVTSQGRSVEEARTNLKEALELYFEDQPFPAEIEPPIIASLDLTA